MDHFRKLNILFGVSCLVLLEIGLNVNGYMSDYPGPYCAQRPGGCCDSRFDECSVPISSKINRIKIVL